MENKQYMIKLNDGDIINVQIKDGETKEFMAHNGVLKLVTNK